MPRLPRRDLETIRGTLWLLSNVGYFDYFDYLVLVLLPGTASRIYLHTLHTVLILIFHPFK